MTTSSVNQYYWPLSVRCTEKDMPLALVLRLTKLFAEMDTYLFLGNAQLNCPGIGCKCVLIILGNMQSGALHYKYISCTFL